jgi:hypothetical protein
MRLSQTVLLNTEPAPPIDWTIVRAWVLGGTLCLSVWGAVLHWAGAF